MTRMVMANQTRKSPTSQAKRYELLLEIIAVLLMGVASLSTSWSGYQASRWGGVQATRYSQAGALRTEAGRATAAANQLRAIDVMLFGNWLNAYAAENTELEQFYRQRFRSEFKPAFEAWVASDPRANLDTSSSPFTQPEYRLSQDDEAARLEEGAAQLFTEGQAANQQSDNYVLNAVILASVLFFSGIAQRFQWLKVRASLLALAIVMCLIGLYNIAAYPIY